MKAVEARWARARARFAPLVAALLLPGTLAGIAVTAVTAPPAAAQSSPDLAPPDGHHAHKVQFPTRDEAEKGVGNDGQVHGAAGRAGTNNLTYGGGVDGIGTNVGPQQVYVVFWGSQWGQVTGGTQAAGNLTFANDPQSMAPRVESLFHGIGTGGELW